MAQASFLNVRLASLCIWSALIALQKACAVVHEAIQVGLLPLTLRCHSDLGVPLQEDQNSNWEEAFKLYRNALDYFALAYKYEKNAKLKELVRVRLLCRFPFV